MVFGKALIDIAPGTDITVQYHSGLVEDTAKIIGKSGARSCSGIVGFYL